MSIHWENRYQLGDTPWDKGRPSPPLLEFLAQHPVRGRVLVPGCGFGHDASALAQQGATVTGLDYAPSAIHRATTLYASEPQLRFIQGDFLHPEPALAENFEWIVEHTLFCALDPTSRPAYAAAAEQWLQPGGSLLAVFYLNPDKNSAPPHPVTATELDALFSPRFSLATCFTPTHAFPGREGREQVRHYRLRGRPAIT